MGMFDFSPDDLAQLQQVAAQFGPSEDDKRMARGFAALQAAAGLLGTRRGFEGQGIGNAINGGLLGYQADLKDLGAQRAQSLNAAMQAKNMLMQMNIAKQFGNLMQQPGTQPGPAQPFQIPGGAAGAMNQSLGLTPPTANSLPTQVPNQNLRQQLADLNLMSNAVGGKDMSAAIKLKFPDIIPLRAGAGAYDPATGKITPNPVAPPGFYYDANTNSYIPVANGQEAEAKSRATGKAVDMSFMKPDEQVGPGGAMVRPRGSALDQMYPGGNLPYSAPQPFAAPAQAIPTPDASTAPAVAPAAPAGPVVVKQSPQQTSEQEGRGKTYADQAATIDSAAAAAQSANARNKEMRALFDQFDTGSLTPARRGIAGVAQGLGAPDSLTNTIAGGNYAAMAAAQKQVVNSAFETTKALTNRPAQAEVIMSATKGTANELMPKAAITAILDYNDGVNRWLAEKQAAKDSWLKDNNSLEGFEGAWNRMHPLDSYIPSVDQLKAVLANSRGKSAPQANNLTVNINGTPHAFPSQAAYNAFVKRYPQYAQ